ncbi:PREDICTED: fer-1-like protein 5 [Pseudopodoces humilis]|uniref:fer-1-like protein 5 n=1 Tax=Pseudopodoces humilis TaxID=181119 RepID=UPI0006B745AC|nr:PREDICTED: fer-1-like protein 5 [Pseudopodoces humilis]
MLRCHAVAARIPGATGSGGGVLLSVSFRAEVAPPLLCHAGVPRRTRVVPEERSPTWNEELVWPLDTRPLSATDALELRLRRWDCPLPQGDLGATTVSLDELVAKPSVPVALRDIPLLDHRERPTGHTVTFLCSFDAHGSTGDIAVTQGPVSPVPPAVSPADRREDFQVRVRVIKGHQLRGKDIKPVVRVRIGKRNFHTRSRSGNNPYFNEVFCQNFRLTPEQLVAQNIHIQVLRSPHACIKPVIGDFQLDIGTVYSAPVEPARPCQGSVKVSVRVGFAGRTLCTRGVPLDANPEWNEVLSFPLRLPPVCDEILLEILRGSCRNKTLARATLRLPQICREPEELEEGTPHFLPSFGPSFVPLYGPRPDAARSRLPRCQLGLCGVFYSVSSVPAGPEPLSLELGIGGAAAATAPERPRCDGNLHHYLPWFGDKPVAAVTSHWEDAGHRWDSLNLLRALGQRLERNLAELRQHRGGSSGSVRARLLRELAQDCTDALGWLEAQPAVTALDQQLRGSRRLLLRQLRRLAEGDPEKIPELRGDALGTAARGWLRRVAALAVEPQAGVPDVQLWLVRGQRRVASARVAATDVLHSPRGPGACGRLCGRILTLFLGCGDSQAQVRLRLWLGRVGESGDLERLLGGSLSFYCHTLEEQTRLWGHWGPRKILGLPAFSSGPPPGQLRPPPGWRWAGPWSLERPPRVSPRPEPAVSAVLEELYETQRREPGGSWSPAGTGSTDSDGQAVPPKEEVACPQGWSVTSDWHVDTEGDVDEDGWQYGLGTDDGSPLAGWHRKGQPCHNLRRRRWLRIRHRDTETRDTDTLSTLERGTAVSPRASPVPSRDIQEPAQDDPGQLPGGSSLTPPQQPPLFILCSFQRPGRFQLRCYIFQALDLAPGSSRTPLGATPGPRAPLPRQPGALTVSLSPGVTAQVSFVSLSQRTRAVRGAPEPRWEQTLLFPGVLLFGDPRGTQQDPPAVVVEVCEQRGQGAGALLGRSVCLPRVWLDVRHREPPRLQPHPLHGPRGPAGELLAAFELLHEPEDGTPAPLRLPPLRNGEFGFPPELRPRLQRVALEVLAWGLRGLRGAVREPRLELQWGEQSLWTPPIQDMATDPNFPSNAFVLTLVSGAGPEGPSPGSGGTAGDPAVSPQALPEEERFVPPIRLRLWAGTERRLLLGQASVRDLGRFRCPPPRPERLLGSGSGSHTAVAMPEDLLSPPVSSSLWKRLCSFLLATAPARTAQDLLSRLRNIGAEDQIYGCELEAVPEFEGLQDFCQTFPLYKPGRPRSAAQPPEPVGSFKGLFRIYPVPEEAGPGPAVPRYFQRLPPREPQRCLLRVYIVRAFELSPRDVTGLSDPYVRVSLGKRTLGQREQYVPNTLEPVFGRLFELTATIPLEKDLRVTIMDHDKVPPDQEIGSTTIDLENRLLSPRRAHCGLPARYHTPGVPERGDPPLGPPGAARERLALHVLNLCELVPEHLETRSLRNREQPGLEQGKVQMWVDIFPVSLGPPGPPFNIDPRKAEGYELRCVVWRVRDADLGDINLLGQRMSDIYVCGWLDGLPEHRQHTDVHYRSLDGNGAFNWRFVFPFEFLAAEKLCAIHRKEHVWSLDQTLLKVPPKLILQVWDNDKFKADDLLGILELELTRLPRPARSPGRCRLSPRELPRLARSCCRGPGLARPTLDLFRRRRARGWWPCTLQEDGGQRVSGKLELSLELLTAREAEERPVGKGREEPNKHPTLPEPKRPKSSFLWLQSPLSLVRHGLRWRYPLSIGLGLAALLLLLLALRSFLPNRAVRTQNRAPRTQNRAPRTQNRDSRTQNRAPRTQNRAPHAQNRDSRNQNRAVRTQNRAPRTQNRALHAQNRALGSSQRPVPILILRCRSAGLPHREGSRAAPVPAPGSRPQTLRIRLGIRPEPLPEPLSSRDGIAPLQGRHPGWNSPGIAHPLPSGLATRLPQVRIK